MVELSYFFLILLQKSYRDILNVPHKYTYG